MYEQPHVGSANPRHSKVGFAEKLVTGISRPLTNDEHWALYDFEVHAQNCPRCFSPFKVLVKQGQTLCHLGTELAQDVTELAFSITRDGYIEARDQGRRVRVEVPENYTQTKSLYKAFWHGSDVLDRSHGLPPRPSTTAPYRTRLATPKRRSMHDGPGPKDSLTYVQRHDEKQNKRRSVAGSEALLPREITVRTYMLRDPAQTYTQTIGYALGSTPQSNKQTGLPAFNGGHENTIPHLNTRASNDAAADAREKEVDAVPINVHPSGKKITPQVESTPPKKGLRQRLRKVFPRHHPK